MNIDSSSSSDDDDGLDPAYAALRAAGGKTPQHAVGGSKKAKKGGHTAPSQVGKGGKTQEGGDGGRGGGDGGGTRGDTHGAFVVNDVRFAVCPRRVSCCLTCHATAMTPSTWGGGPCVCACPCACVQLVTRADGNVSKLPSTMFEIPVLPRGRQLLINILSTWGDPYYVGLMGLEVFDGTGHPVPVTEVWADPPDINVLPEYNGDPRTVDKLVDGHNFTCDDLHAWLAPFKRGAYRCAIFSNRIGCWVLPIVVATAFPFPCRQHCVHTLGSACLLSFCVSCVLPGDNHLVGFDLGRPTAVSMIRVWNYNKNRIHSYRGARCVQHVFVLFVRSLVCLLFCLLRKGGGGGGGFGKGLQNMGGQATLAPGVQG